MKIWEPKPPGTLWAKHGLLQDCFTFLYYTFTLTLFFLNLSAITNRRIWARQSFHKDWRNFCRIYRSCTLHPVKAVSFSYYYSTYFLPYFLVVHVEYSLCRGQWPVWLYKYFVIVLQTAVFLGGWRDIACFPLNMYYYTSYNYVYNILYNFRKEFWVVLSEVYLGLGLSCVMLRPVSVKFR